MCHVFTRQYITNVEGEWQKIMCSLCHEAKDDDNANHCNSNQNSKDHRIETFARLLLVSGCLLDILLCFLSILGCLCCVLVNHLEVCALFMHLHIDLLSNIIYVLHRLLHIR